MILLRQGKQERGLYKCNIEESFSKAFIAAGIGIESQCIANML